MNTIKIPSLDFETYSEAGFAWDGKTWGRPSGYTKTGLLAVGAPVYAEHLSTEILCVAWDMKDGKGVHLWKHGEPEPLELTGHVAKGGFLSAWNSSFEFYIWNYVGVRKLGWPPIKIGQLLCPSAKASAWGLPGSLAKAGMALDIKDKKDEATGKRVMKVTMPRKPTLKLLHTRHVPKTDPELFNQLYSYNVQDVIAETVLNNNIPELSDFELEIWRLDQRINTRGVQIDTYSMEKCLSIIRMAENKYTQELRKITGFENITSGKRNVILGWLEGQGVYLETLDKHAVAEALNSSLTNEAQRVLEIRQILSAISIGKLRTIERMTSSDGRLRNLFQYCGARQTKRFAGRNAQPQNLPNSGPFKVWGPSEIEEAFGNISIGSLQLLEVVYNNQPIKAVSGCLRGLFCSAPEHELICSDYSAIEAVCLAELAKESWRQKVFRDHGKIYEMSASKISNIPFKDFMEHKDRTGEHHPLRKSLGKVAELASGYQGWINAWKQFGADEFMSDSEIKESILKWRKESPAIVNLWYKLEEAAIKAVEQPSRTFEYHGIMYCVSNNVLYCRLLSHGLLTYHQPKIINTIRYEKSVKQLTFIGWNTDPTKGLLGWQRRETYGGRLAENITQATARDILVYAMLNLEKAGYPIVLHVHDEIVCEVPKGFGSIEEFEKIMGSMPKWCENWPVRASGGWRGNRYHK